MKKTLKISAYIIVFGIFLIQVIPMIRKVLNKKCDDFNSFLRANYNGKVTKKFANPQEHSQRNLEIQNFKTNNTEMLTLDLDITDFYDKVNINDTLIKINRSDTVIILNNNGKFFYKLDFDCNK
jgi:uncharacterized protein YxeA